MSILQFENMFILEDFTFKYQSTVIQEKEDLLKINKQHPYHIHV